MKFIELYLDDVLTAFFDVEGMLKVTLNLEERFSINMIGTVKQFHGITVHETDHSCFFPSRACTVTHSARSTLNISELLLLR